MTGSAMPHDANPVPIASWSHILPTYTRLVAYEPTGRQRLDKLACPVIPHGAGHSFGDVAYVSGGTTLTTQRLESILDFDSERGIINCQSGVPMITLHAATSGSGWAYPIYGGTRWATVGGAIGNDIHGKNHPVYGAFSNHILGFHVITTDGSCIKASPTEQSDLFSATIGGLGLTGLITRIQLQLVPMPSETVRVRAVDFHSFDAMRACFNETDDPFQFGWLDDTYQTGLRGLHYRAAFTHGSRPRAADPRRPRLPYLRLTCPMTIRPLNALRYHRHRGLDQRMHVIDLNYWGDLFDYRRYLFGHRGFHEYHFVVPDPHFEEALMAFHQRLRRVGLTPYFTVIKRFGSIEPQGLLSFPCAGYTMNTQFANTPETVDFLRTFTDLLIELGGRVYLAKDSCITQGQLAKMYPELDRWREVVQRYDPRGLLQSNLARRLELKPW